MAENTLTVVAFLTAKEGREEETREALLALIEPTHQEEGCINYDLHVSRDNPATFLFHENWLSKEHLDRHLETDHLVQFLGRVDDLLAKPPEILLFDRIS